MPAGYEALLIGAQGDGTALSNSAAATSILPAQSKYTLPAGFVDQVGKKFRVTAHGRVSNIVTTPGTLTLSLRLGAVIAATSAALQLNAVAKTNVAWFLDWILTARVVGSAAQFMHQGVWASESVVGSPLPSAGGAGELLLQPSAPALGTAFDATVSNIVDLFAAFSIANAGNAIQLHDFALESLN